MRFGELTLCWDRVAPLAVVVVVIPRVCWVMRATARAAVKAASPLTAYKNADKEAFM